jgi:hypothetical protein
VTKSTAKRVALKVALGKAEYACGKLLPGKKGKR